MDVRLCVELDDRALASHKRNFPQSSHLNADVSTLSASQILNSAGLRRGELDGLIGGPPCQGFSIIGKREVSDERNDMLGHFGRLAVELSPKFFVMENVTGLLHDRNAATVKSFLRRVRRKYDVCEPITVKASNCGAPTSRTRVFFVGIRMDVAHSALSAESVGAIADIDEVFVDHALRGLPLSVDEDWRSNPLGKARIHEVQNSVFRQKIFDHRPPGIGCSEVLRLLEKSNVLNHQGTVHSLDLRRRYEALAQGEQDYVTKSVRLRAKGFCPTLRAGTGKDRGSFQAVRPIHYRKGRVITPREAARLQSFPDWFAFDHTKWQAFRQIGNSVPPLLAEAVLRNVMNHIP
jgi:DNA (cytosine-5)-methyltransferase 1